MTLGKLWNYCSELMYKKASANPDILDAGANFYFIEDKKTDTEAGIWVKDKTAVVCFMQTEDKSFLDWLYNFIIIPWKSGKDWYHLGYLIKANRIKKQVWQLLDSKGCTDIAFVGYSQGGAIAAIIAGDKYYSYTVGCPNYTASPDKERKSINVKISSDIITVLPPIYKKHGVILALNTDNKYNFADHLKYDDRFKEFD